MLFIPILAPSYSGGGPGVGLKLPAWKVGDRGLESHSGIRVSKKQNVSSSLTRKDPVLWRASVTER